MLNFTKTGSGAEVADLPTFNTLEVRLTFEQGGGRGLAGRLRNRLNPADPDLWVIAFSDGMPVNRVDPKVHQTALDGALRHLGDAKGDGQEVVVLDATRLTGNLADIDAFAFVASISGEDGFARVAGVVAEISDTSGGRPEFLANVRFDITGTHSSALLAVVKRDADGKWTFTKKPEYGHAGSWQQLARLATAHVR